MKISANAGERLGGGKEGETFMAACKDTLDSPIYIAAIMYSQLAWPTSRETPGM